MTAGAGRPTGSPARSAWALIGLSVVGLGIAAYLTSVHFANVPLACSATGVVDCTRVLTSRYSVLPGTAVPITVPGMLWFLVSLGLAVAQVRQPARRALRRLHLAWAALGTLTVLYLVGVELLALHTICLWCSGVHLLVVATLLTTVYRATMPSPPAAAVPRRS